MNQHRWTCLTTILLTAVIAPVANAATNTLSTSPGEARDKSPLSPQSLPTITPLTVTELEIETAVPATIRAVPKVSKLPTVQSGSGNKTKISTRNKHSETKLISLPTKNLATAPAPTQLSAPIPLFNPNFRSTAAIFSSPGFSESSTSQVNAVAPLPQVQTTAVKRQLVKSVTARAVSAPIEIVRGDKSQPSVITNSISAQADVVSTPQVDDSRAALNPVPQNTQVIPTPQVAPLITATDSVHPERLRQSVEIPSFESGLPVFIFETDHPKQIVATAIAQIDGTIVAPELSIAIPVERPKQATIPTRSPAASAPAPVMVKIEPPAVVQPALDKIVSTQIGQASWYGSEGGSKTANGERYNPRGLTAAHRSLPFGTKVRVTSLTTGRAVIVRINDRGPFHRSRTIDISAGAAEVIGLKSQGVGRVKMEVLESE